MEDVSSIVSRDKRNFIDFNGIAYDYERECKRSSTKAPQDHEKYTHQEHEEQ
jgi:hypothetical protein